MLLLVSLNIFILMARVNNIFIVAYLVRSIRLIEVSRDSGDIVHLGLDLTWWCASNLLPTVLYNFQRIEFTFVLAKVLYSSRICA